MLGLLLPGEFIPEAEEAGLIGRLTLRVLDLAVAQAAAWAADGWPTRVAVNLSATDLSDMAFIGAVTSAIARHGLATSALEVEVTESAAFADPVLAVRILDELDQSGIDVAVDDYGSGFSSLAYLKRLPARRIKLDRTLVSDLTDEHVDQVIVRSTLQLARDLGLSVIAEGVEDDDTLLILRELGCDAAQGFGLCRPQPADTVRPAVARTEARLSQVLAHHDHRSARA